MVPNKVLRGRQARQKIDEAVELLMSVIPLTISPRGRNVGFFLPGDNAQSIHDGVEIAKRMRIADPFQYWAIRIILQAAVKQVQVVGDGTSVTVLLACEIYKQAMALIAAGLNPRSLEDELMKNRDLLLADLKKHSRKIKTEKEAIAVATISAQDEKLGRQIGEIVYKMTLDGVVTVDKSDTSETVVDYQEGCQFENGYISPFFVTDPLRMEATVEKCKILITDKPIYAVQDITPIAEQMAKINNPNLVIIAQDISSTALQSMIQTTIRMRMENKGMNLLGIRAPYAGQVQKDFLDDLAVLTGATVISSQAGRRMDTITLDELGEADRVTATENASLIVGGKGNKEDIDARVLMLKNMRDEQYGKSDYEKEKIKERYAKLSTGVAVVKVGAPLEAEQSNWIERAKDAVQATTSSLEYGYVPGGETVYLSIREKLDKTSGGRILYKALERPFSVLLENAGLKPDRYVEKIEDGSGVDVLDGKLKNMIEANIIDPAAVPVESLKNAISSAISLFTTEVLIMPDYTKEIKAQ